MTEVPVAPSAACSPRATIVYRSLLEVKTIAGVEDRVAILNATFALAIVMASGLWPLILVAAGLHAALARCTREDPYLRRVYLCYVRQSGRYDPWPSVHGRSGRRPNGFGRGLLC
jgi:type IV secretion system protein TrbD